MDTLTWLMQSLPIYHSPRLGNLPPQTMQMISQDEAFTGKGLEDFMKLHECGVSYAVVAIMGPQNSGKSTLLNHLFSTNFEEMGESSDKRWTTTTRGIWISEAQNMDQFTLVMDVEGTDSIRKGEDDTRFEKQTTLFSLVVADILIINMWCRDAGRVHAANWPLLRTIFEEMVQKFSNRPRKTTLHFVIRDNDKAKFGDLKNKVSEQIQKIWEKVIKTDDIQNAPLSQFFNVEIDALSHYKYEKATFIAEVVKLRKKIQGSIWLAGDRRDVIPTSGFSLHAKKLWEAIQLNRNLDIPSNRQMVGTTRCEEIASAKLRLFESNKKWLKVKAAAEVKFVKDFSAEISPVLEKYLSEYDAESKYFEEAARNARRQHLEAEALRLVHPAFTNTLGHLRAKILKKFKNLLKEDLNGGGGYGDSVLACQESCLLMFDQRCSDAAIEKAEWDASIVRKELEGDMGSHALLVRNDRLSKLVEEHQGGLAKKVNKHLNLIFNEESINWPSIRSFLKRDTDSTASSFRSNIAAFELDNTTVSQKLHHLNQYARNLVVDKLKEEIKFLMRRMQGSYTLALAKDEAEPYRECLKVLSTMAVIRLDESAEYDEVESLLLSALKDDGGEAPADDPLASDTWNEVPPEITLITPRECRDIWIKFKQDIKSKIIQVLSTENEDFSYFDKLPGKSGTSEVSKSKIPFWARMGTWLLGLADFVSLLWRRCPDAAIQLYFPLAEDAIELAKEYAERTKEMVKNGLKRMEGKYQLMMNKLKEFLERFYNFMKAKFTTKSEVSYVQYGSSIKMD